MFVKNQIIYRLKQKAKSEILFFGNYLQFLFLFDILLYLLNSKLINIS